MIYSRVFSTKIGEEGYELIVDYQIRGAVGEIPANIRLVSVVIETKGGDLNLLPYLSTAKRESLEDEAYSDLKKASETIMKSVTFS